MEKIYTHKEMLDLGNNHNFFLKQYLGKFDLPKSSKELGINILTLTKAAE